MAWMNFWCSIYYGAYLFGATGIGADLVAFCLSHSDVALDLLLFCLCGAIGQVRLRNPILCIITSDYFLLWPVVGPRQDRPRLLRMSKSLISATRSAPDFRRTHPVSGLASMG